MRNLPNEKQKIAENTFLDLKNDFDNLQDEAKSKDKYSFITTRREALDKIGGLEEYFYQMNFPILFQANLMIFQDYLVEQK